MNFKKPSILIYLVRPEKYWRFWNPWTSHAQRKPQSGLCIWCKYLSNQYGLIRFARNIYQLQN